MSKSTAEIRPAPLWLFVLLLAVHIVMTVLGNQWFLPSGIWKSPVQLSYGLVTPSLIWGLMYLLVVVCGVLLGLGGRRPTEIGIEWQKLPAGATYTCLLWFGLQMVLAAWYSAFAQSFDVADGWFYVDTLLDMAGSLAGQLLGNALCEEIVFRGFLLMQFALIFRSWWPQRPRTAPIVALLLAAAIFAVQHVPYHLRPDRYVSLTKLASDQLWVFLMGCIFGWIYWQTRNLFFVVGVHALANYPTALWATPGPHAAANFWFLVLALVCALVWKRLPLTQESPRANRD
jgi:membrane protease YdiL (CAAX protease family)